MALDLKKLVGTRLRAIRKARSMTQEQVATAIDRTVETVSNIERGVSIPGLETLQSICTVLEVPVSDILEVASEDKSPDRIAGEAVIVEQIRRLSDNDFSVAAKTVAALANR